MPPLGPAIPRCVGVTETCVFVGGADEPNPLRPSHLRLGYCERLSTKHWLVTLFAYFIAFVDEKQSRAEPGGLSV
jgi:hypothetical protein